MMEDYFESTEQKWYVCVVENNSGSSELIEKELGYKIKCKLTQINIP